MDTKSWSRFFELSLSPNLKSKIHNLKWAGFLAILVLLAGYVGTAEAQQPTKVHRIGYLSPVSPSSESTRAEAFRQGLRELGYAEGQNITIDWRFAEGKLESLPALAAELFGLKAHVIVARGTPPTHAAKQVTSTIPIVMAVSADPVGTGLVASLARPGGNVTGVTTVAAEISGKRLELLKEVVPRATRVAVLWNSANSAMALRVKEVQGVAGPLGVNLQMMGVQEPNDFERQFSAMTQERADALLVVLDPFTSLHRKRIFEYAAKSRLPAIYEDGTYANDGGLIAYGPNLADMFHRVAYLVDKVLKGTKPADIPIEQPKKFELFINLKTAKQIGLAIPPNVLMRADKVIK